MERHDTDGPKTVIGRYISKSTVLEHTRTGSHRVERTRHLPDLYTEVGIQLIKIGNIRHLLVCGVGEGGGVVGIKS